MQENLLKSNMTILFQGDSITDCGRQEDDTGLGGGYVRIIASLLSAQYAHLDLKIINRGISGNRAVDLERRWDKDCLELTPGLVSILIGINDTWRRFDSKDPTSAADFFASYQRILTRTRKSLPQCHLVLCEPFLLPHPADRVAWREDLDPKIMAVRELAREFGAGYVPFDGAFAAASTQAPCAHWAGDGVHPTPAGHGLMACVWLRDALGITIK